MDFNATLMIKLLLITRYKFRYMVPSIPPFLKKKSMQSSESIDTEVALGIVWPQILNILKLKYFIGTVGLMWSTTTTQNNLFEHRTDRLAFKLLMLIIEKQLFILVSNWLLFFLYSSWLEPPVTEIKLKRENIYVWMQKIQFETKMWWYKLMFGKNISTMCPSFCVYIYIYIYIYINLTHTPRDPGQLNWEFDYQILCFYYWGPSGQATGDMC